MPPRRYAISQQHAVTCSWRGQGGGGGARARARAREHMLRTAIAQHVLTLNTSTITTTVDVSAFFPSSDGTSAACFIVRMSELFWKTSASSASFVMFRDGVPDSFDFFSASGLGAFPPCSSMLGDAPAALSVGSSSIGTSVYSPLPPGIHGVHVRRGRGKRSVRCGYCKTMQRTCGGTRTAPRSHILRWDFPWQLAVRGILPTRDKKKHLWSTMSTADLDALLKLLSDDTKAMEAVGANFQRTFPKSDHFRLAATIWCVPAVACVGGCVGDVGGDGRGRGAAARSKSGQPRSVRTRVRAPVVSVSVAFAVSVTVSVSLSVRVRARRVRACARIFASTQETASTLTQGVCSLLIQERAIELTQRVFGFYILFDLYKSESPGTNPFLPVLLDQVCATFGVLVPCATHTHTHTHIHSLTHTPRARPGHQARSRALRTATHPTSPRLPAKRPSQEIAARTHAATRRICPARA